LPEEPANKAEQLLDSCVKANVASGNKVDRRQYIRVADSFEALD
jgi:hypothetical protein